MDRTLEETTIHSYPHAFVNRSGDPILITTLNDKRCEQLIAMYMAYRPRNSFQGLPPITDEACLKWVQHMIGHGINVVALSFDDGVIGHDVLFPIDHLRCELLTVVAPAYQNTGVGTELVRIAIQLSDEIGFEEVKLTVEMTNAIARHVYKKCGFEYQSDHFEGEVDMAMDLKGYREAVSAHVADIMKREVITIEAHQPCKDALRVFLTTPVASLPVVDSKGRLAGIVTKTDLMIPANVGKRVNEVYTQNVVTVRQSCTIAKVIRMLQSKRVRALPVIDRHGQLVGVIGRREILTYYSRHL
jgi:CBS domain-containing protein